MIYKTTLSERLKRIIIRRVITRIDVYYLEKGLNPSVNEIDNEIIKVIEAIPVGAIEDEDFRELHKRIREELDK